MTKSPRIRLRTLALLLVLLPGLAACGKDRPAVEPSPIDGPSPFRYPVTLWDEGAEGEVVVMARVTEAGTVDSALVSRSSGREAFDSAAVAGARLLHFVPGHRGGRTLRMWVRLPVRFTRDSVALSTGD
jgi:TonB family protein